MVAATWKQREMVAVAAGQPSWAHAPAVAGAVSGAAQVLAEHPLDSLKVRLQSRLAAFTCVGGGPLAMLRHTLRVEGAAALYQGLSPRLLTNSLVKISLFTLYEQWLPLCGGSPLLAGGLAGACNSLVSCPQDLLKSRLQVLRVARLSAAAVQRGMPHAPHAPHTPVALGLQLLRAHGPLVFYRGWGALLVRDTFGYAALFSLYSSEGLRERLPLWLVGGLSGFSFYLLTLPIDRAKTVLMTMRSPPPEMASPPATPLWRETVARFSGWRAARGVVLAEGWRGLYRGGSVTLLRTFVGQAVALSVYSCTLLQLQG